MLALVYKNCFETSETTLRNVHNLLVTVYTTMWDRNGFTKAYN